MKKILQIALLTCASMNAFAQAPSCLDSVIVETYYIAEPNDTNSNSLGGGILPLGSTTYRIYVDMAPGCKFQAAYGIDVQPTGTYTDPGDHELRISTTTLFFNNEDRGAINPTWNSTYEKNNTVMLDSWLSVGGACNGYFGVMKTEDNGVNTVVNADGLLQSTNPLAGIPVSTQDGLLAGTPEAVTMVGIATESAMFDNQNDGTNGPVFSTYNGSWASLNGSAGPTATNRVLIAQITTDGKLCFDLNLQLGTPTAGVSENWVASNPVGNEATHPSLSYCSTVGIKQVNNAAAVSFGIWPNPAGEALTLDINENSGSMNNSYSVYSLDGRMIMTKKIGQINGNYQERIDLSSMPAGMYFVEVNANGVKSTKKFIKN